MNRKKIHLILVILTLLASAVGLTRCGSGVGASFNASATGAKF